MVIILFALGAMVCASVSFLAGAMWAAMPQLRDKAPDSTPVFRLSSSPVVERDSLTLAR